MVFVLEYQNFLIFDVTIVRIIWAFAIIVGGTGLLAYILCALIMPDKSEIDFNNNNF